jgi:hypothetical protein
MVHTSVYQLQLYTYLHLGGGSGSPNEQFSFPDLFFELFRLLCTPRRTLIALLAIRKQGDNSALLIIASETVQHILHFKHVNVEVRKTTSSPIPTLSQMPYR